jgi:serine/threonine-protein kinase RsbW
MVEFMGPESWAKSRQPSEQRLDTNPEVPHMAEAVGQTLSHEPIALALPFSAESAAVARQQLLDWMNCLDAHDESRDDARLVVSELVGNAVRHARPLADGTMKVCWGAGPTGLDIAVTDGGARTTPGRVDAGVSDLAGRGLAIVETLASRWWVESTRSRTTVHAVLALV